MPHTRLLETKPIHHPKQVPTTPNTRSDLTGKRCQHILEIQYTLGIQQCMDQRRGPTQSSVQDQIWGIQTERDVFWSH